MLAWIQGWQGSPEGRGAIRLAGVRRRVLLGGCRHLHAVENMRVALENRVIRNPHSKHVAHTKLLCRSLALRRGILLAWVPAGLVIPSADVAWEVPGHPPPPAHKHTHTSREKAKTIPLPKKISSISINLLNLKSSFPRPPPKLPQNPHELTLHWCLCLCH